MIREIEFDREGKGSPPSRSHTQLNTRRNSLLSFHPEPTTPSESRSNLLPVAASS
jgi:hypothetical protein